jgi:hypothetical protein
MMGWVGDMMVSLIGDRKKGRILHWLIQPPSYSALRCLALNKVTYDIYSKPFGLF